MTERRRLRRPWLAVGAAAAVLVAGVGFGWWWTWDHAPARVPGSACWSVLTKDDLKPFAEQAHGTFLDDLSPKDHPGLKPDPRPGACVLHETSGGGRGESLMWVDLLSENEISAKDRYYADGQNAQPGSSRLDFGPDVQGSVRRQIVHAVFRCENPELAAGGTPYVVVGVASGTAIDVTSKEAHRAVLDIALKYIRAVAANYPCSNPLRLPGTVPQVPANFPPLDH